MDKACSDYFNNVIASSVEVPMDLSDRMLSGLQYFVSALYLSRQIGHEEEQELRNMIKEAQLNRGIIS